MYEIFIKLLEEKGITPYRVGKETGIAPSTFTDWKSGRSVPKQEKLKKIANFLDVSVDYLMTGEEPQVDYLYTDENAQFLIEVTKMAKDKDFVNRMQKYMELVNDSRKSVDDMIDFMYEKQTKDEN